MEYRQYYLSPLGFLEVVASQKQIIAINFVSKKKKSKNNVLTQKGVVQLKEYFSKLRQNFSLPLAIEGTDFQKQVYRALLKIPFGSIISYSDLAQMIGRPRAQRAVGSALAKNPLPIVVPCHRVLASGGKLGAYSGGLKIKKGLLALEKRTLTKR
ncbi:MAG: methylated-DNA--[protein]-cysteine S-methyltransferase [Patescibacteria group bacterium]|nr:methylated-DNA--[protein]-cysteine S-methyltransferase [Patescibacteria group bacterium]